MSGIVLDVEDKMVSQSSDSWAGRREIKYDMMITWEAELQGPTYLGERWGSEGCSREGKWELRDG